MEDPAIVDNENPEVVEETLEREQRNIERARANRDERNKIRSEYMAVWKKFYDWEPRAGLSMVQSLSAMVEGVGVANVRSEGATHLSEYVHDMVVDEASPSEPFTLNDLDYDGDVTVVNETRNAGMLFPYPKYECCAPTMRNIKTDERESVLRFVQYAGESGFDERALVKEKRELAWQYRWQNPDVPLIAVETVKRLSNMSMSYETIDRQKLLPPLESIDNRPGLFQRMYRRDLWSWEGHAGPCGNDRTARAPSDTRLFEQVDEYVNCFCPNMNCLDILCLPHKEPTARLFEGNPHITSDAMRTQTRRPCGDQCFLSFHEDEMDIIEWPSAYDIHVINGVLHIFADEKPCKLSRFCRLPCYQIYLQRRELFPDKFISPETRALQGTILQSFQDTINNDDGERFSPIDFCYHSGPCSKKSGCPCFINALHCRRNCRCNLNCKLRYPGCKCMGDCDTRCTCVLDGRECDPEACKQRKRNLIFAPKTKNYHSLRHRCENMHLQLSKFPKIIIKTGLHGLGTFAGKEVVKDAPIGEYVAELFPEQAVEQMLADHIGLNYTFNLNRAQVLDSAHVGNETRCVNHLPSERANVDVKIEYVNGDHRILFYAKTRISSGQELFFDYGPGYWKGKDPSMLIQA